MTVRGRQLALLLLCVAAAPLIYLRCRVLRHYAFWDARVYAHSIAHFTQGKSAYDLPGELPFIYPPIFVLVGAWLERLLPQGGGWKVYLSASMASTVGIPLVLARFYLRRLKSLEAIGLFLLAPFLLTEEVFFGANISVPCYFLALLSAAPGLARNRWRWFYMVVVLAAAVKITFLILLLIPLLAGVGQVISSFLVTLVTGSVYVLQRVLAADLYHQFRAALSGQTFGARNYGYAPFGMAANLLERFHVIGYVIPGAVQILFVLVILLVMFLLRPRVDVKGDRWLALIIVTVVLINPRMFDYDIVVALVPAYFLLMENWRSLFTLLLTAITFCGFFIGHGAMGSLFLLVSAFVVGTRSLAVVAAEA